MKKIAICYSGQPRDLKNTYKNHVDFLYEPLRELGYEIDVFAHIWFDENNLGLPFWAELPQRGRWSEDFKEIFEHKLNAKKIKYEAPKKFDDFGYVPDPRFPHPLQNTISMFYSIEIANKIKNQYAQENGISYEVVFRIRPDIYFSEKLVNIDLSYLDQVNVIHDPNKHMNYAIGDHFAYASSSIMDIYSSVFTNFKCLCEQGSAVNPECLLGFNLLINKVLVRTHSLGHLLYRDVVKTKKLLNLLASIINANK